MPPPGPSESSLDSGCLGTSSALLPSSPHRPLFSPLGHAGLLSLHCYQVRIRGQESSNGLFWLLCPPNKELDQERMGSGRNRGGLLEERARPAKEVVAMKEAWWCRSLWCGSVWIACIVLTFSSACIPTMPAISCLQLLVMGRRVWSFSVSLMFLNTNMSVCQRQRGHFLVSLLTRDISILCVCLYVLFCFCQSRWQGT